MPPPVVLIGLDPGRYKNGHISYVLAHARAASSAGYEPHVFCVGSPAGSERTDYATIHRVATPVQHFLLAQVNTRPVAGAITEYLASSDAAPPYIVHGFGTWGGAAVDATGRLERRGIPAVPLASGYTAAAHEWRGLLRGLDASHGPRAWARHAAWYPWVRAAVAPTERRGFQRASVVLVNYDSVTRLLQQAYGTQLAIRRIPYASAMAFDPAWRSDNAPIPASLAALEPADAPLIVSVSRHSPCKGVDVLLRALGALKADGVAFRACLVGPGRLLDAHRKLSRNLGLDGQVATPGEVDDVRPYLRAADVFALPSLEEGSGSVALLEALQMGAAVVASNCDGIPEDLTDGDDGLLVPPGDAGALRDALATVLTNHERRAELAVRGHELFKRRFSAERFASALREVYTELGVPA